MVLVGLLDNIGSVLNGVLDNIAAACSQWNNILVLAGIFFTINILHSILVDVIYGLKAYVFPKLAHLIRSPNFVEKYGEWAVITGCTGGIGEEYAKQLGELGMNLVLVSRSKAKLDALERDVRAKYGVNTMVIVADFTDSRVLPEIARQIKASGIDVGVLVNNVGILGPHFQPFLELDAKIAEDMITVNITAATMLCHHMLPDMISKGKGAIINISSMASYMAMPYLAEYAATKHYMRAFTEALATEYKHTGVVIQEVDPGQVVTAMTELFEQPSGLVAPSAKTFVSSAISTLGFTTRTCGYWFHSFITIFFKLTPDWALAKTAENNGKRNYKHALKEKKKMK